jgi:hypothetical protein
MPWFRVRAYIEAHAELADGAPVPGSQYRAPQQTAGIAGGQSSLADLASLGVSVRLVK